MIENIEYRGRASTNEITKEDLPASILFCRVCGAHYHLFFTAPYHVMQSGIDDFFSKHRDCNVEKCIQD